MNAGQWAVLLNVASTWYMVGLIWVIQIVHYAMFDQVGEQNFQRYAVDHARRITPVVGIPMLIELATSAYLVYRPPPQLSVFWLWVGLVMVGLIWLSTAAIQVPCHDQLGRGFDADVCRHLVHSNWIRTVLWSARGVLTFYLVSRLLSAD
ncbi:hypothetical protein [Crateriforma conspicua]|uniref:DUF1772 domain-containing protein n=1 Tax=Crateriforma conspicua TaxID=2527996 RepID=A0A5C6FVH0_9PLAN|nr:hypothetical protein [Crateriforma conspicua]TWU66969.1 hypothetical protein V7x_25410 [Crateriforma conspicua]